MNIFKRRPALILTLGLAIIITIGVSVYIGIIPTNKNIMLKHLEEKYGQEFVVRYIGTRGAGHFPLPIAYYDMSFYPKGGDPETDSVKAEMDPDNKTSTGIKDGYFGILIREGVEAEVLAAISDLPLPMKVYYDPGAYYDNIFDSTKTYADLKQWTIDNRGKPYRPDVTVCVFVDGLDKPEKEDYANQVFDQLGKDGSQWFATVRFYPSEAFEKATRANIFDLYVVRDNRYGVFSKDVNF